MIARAASRSAGVPLALGVAYPVVAHLAILSGRPAFVVASVGLLCTLILLRPLRRGRAWAWLLLVAGVAGLWILSESALAISPLFAPPVLITGGVAWLFGRSLRDGETPLIERIARVMEGADLGEEQRVYARHLTAAWAAFTGTLAMVNFGLALLAEPHGLLSAAGIRPPVTVPIETWSLFANVINYLLLGSMFAVEFAYRRYRFPDRKHDRFVDFILGLRRLGPLFARDRAEP